VKGIWVPISGQIAQQQKVDAIANNIANANTTGFKKDDLIFKEYLTALDNPQDDIDIPRKEFSPEDFYRTQGAENAKVSVAGQYTDFTQGQLVETRNPLDLGIKGTGFFEVLTPNGVRYTRNGIFTIDNQCRLEQLMALSFSFKERAMLPPE
jgi:flagellar basal-body rod protein FlgF